MCQVIVLFHYYYVLSYVFTGHLPYSHSKALLCYIAPLYYIYIFTQHFSVFYLIILFYFYLILNLPRSFIFCC